MPLSTALTQALLRQSQSIECISCSSQSCNKV